MRVPFFLLKPPTETLPLTNNINTLETETLPIATEVIESNLEISKIYMIMSHIGNSKLELYNPNLIVTFYLDLKKATDFAKNYHHRYSNSNERVIVVVLEYPEGELDFSPYNGSNNYNDSNNYNGLMASQSKIGNQILDRIQSLYINENLIDTQNYSDYLTLHKDSSKSKDSLCLVM